MWIFGFNLASFPLRRLYRKRAARAFYALHHRRASCILLEYFGAKFFNRRTRARSAGPGPFLAYYYVPRDQLFTVARCVTYKISGARSSRRLSPPPPPPWKISPSSRDLNNKVARNSGWPRDATRLGRRDRVSYFSPVRDIRSVINYHTLKHYLTVDLGVLTTATGNSAIAEQSCGRTAGRPEPNIRKRS